MNIVWADEERRPELNQAIGDFVSVIVAGEPGVYEHFTSMGVFEDSRIIAGVVYYQFDRGFGTIRVSGAATDKRWLTRTVLREMYAYPFDELGVQMVMQANSARDTKLNRMLTALGFSAHLIPRLRGRDHDGIIFTLTDDAWRAGKFSR